MKWHATHTIKLPGSAPRRVMLNSGALYTREEWETSADTPRYYFAEPDDRADGRIVDRVTPLWGLGSICTIRSRGEGTSTTPLRKPVRRMTTQTTVRYRGELRRAIVALLPGDVVELRIEGCRERRTISVETLWAYAGRLAAQRLVTERKAARAKRRQDRGTVTPLPRRHRTAAQGSA